MNGVSSVGVFTLETHKHQLILMLEGIFFLTMSRLAGICFF